MSSGEKAKSMDVIWVVVAIGTLTGAAALGGAAAPVAVMVASLVQACRARMLKRLPVWMGPAYE
jgi:hypothetical protein